MVRTAFLGVLSLWRGHYVRLGGSLILMIGALAACSSVYSVPPLPSPFPVLPPLSRAQRIDLLQARTTGLRTLTAVLAVSYTVGRQQGAFDLVMNYEATGNRRFTALKETFLSTQILFDLLLQGDTYMLVVHEASGVQTYQGDMQRFAHEHPTFRTFFLVGEAFFLPGIDAFRQAPLLNNTGTRLRTRLRSGVQAQWWVRPETLEITRACLTWQAEDGQPIPVTLQYADYRPYGTYYVPHHIVLRDRRARFQAVSVVKQLDINVPLPPDVWRMTSTTS